MRRTAATSPRPPVCGGVGGADERVGREVERFAELLHFACVAVDVRLHALPCLSFDLVS